MGEQPERIIVETKQHLGRWQQGCAIGCFTIAMIVVLVIIIAALGTG